MPKESSFPRMILGILRNFAVVCYFAEIHNVNIMCTGIGEGIWYTIS